MHVRAQGRRWAFLPPAGYRSLSKKPDGPIRSMFWAAGFSFSAFAWLLEVPYCPHLPYLFFGEEVYMLARMATRGWQVWAPSQALVFHQWERSTRQNSYQACTEVSCHSKYRPVTIMLPTKPMRLGRSVLLRAAGGTKVQSRICC